MEFKDIVGKHLFDAVDMFDTQIELYEGAEYFEDANACRFRLDGIVYEAVEDPDDGYRSMMRDFKIVENAKMKNVFPAVEVLVKHREYGDRCNADILDIIDIKTSKTILSVGTDNTDDYYPWFVCEYHPEAMSTNQNV